MMVHGREIQELPRGCVQITFNTTFYSLSQGNEVYAASGYVRPKPGEHEVKFDIVSMEPSHFHLGANGEQDFTLVVRSKEQVPEDYSELVMVWLHGAPSNPSGKPYLFSTARQYLLLPAFEKPPWDLHYLFNGVSNTSNYVNRDMTDAAEVFVPSKEDLGFDKGRYERNLGEYFRSQLVAGNLPTVDQVFKDNGWDYDHHGSWNWEQIWSHILGSMYWRDTAQQARACIGRLSEHMCFYPVSRRWDWARPAYLPNVAMDVGGMAALAAHIRTVQENMVQDDEQFKTLHNLVLPIYASYRNDWTTTAVLTEDAQEGDMHLHVSRSCYGKTGCFVDGFWGYLNIAGELYLPQSYVDAETFTLREPLRSSYTKGTLVTSWAFPEDLELECRDLMSLIAIGAASRDRAVVDGVMDLFAEILEKQKVFLDDGSFRNEPGSYGWASSEYAATLVKASLLLGSDALNAVSQDTMTKIHNSLIFSLEFAFSNGLFPHLNGGGCMNQLDRLWSSAWECGLMKVFETLFPEDEENILLYKHILEQEQERVPGDAIDNHNFVIHGWGYAMLRSDNGSWDRGMETLLASKHLMKSPGDHVSPDSLGIVVYALGAILTPGMATAGSPVFLRS